MKFSLSLICISFCLFQSCKEDLSEREIASIQNNTTLAVEEKYHQLTKVLLRDEFREFQWIPGEEGKPNTVNVSFGGNSGMTFLDGKAYKKANIRYITLVGLKLFSLYQPQDPLLVRLSFSKPFYIKGESNQDTLLQEFEIFRISWNLDHFLDWKSNYPKVDILNAKAEVAGKNDFVEDFLKKGNRELDEFRRVNLE